MVYFALELIGRTPVLVRSHSDGMSDARVQVRRRALPLTTYMPPPSPPCTRYGGELFHSYGARKSATHYLITYGFIPTGYEAMDYVSLSMYGNFESIVWPCLVPFPAPYHPPPAVQYAHPPPAVQYALPSDHADRVLAGACNPML